MPASGWLSKSLVPAFLFLAGACAPLQKPATLTCPLSGTHPMQTIQLFFGRDVEGRASVTTAEWNDFSSRVIAHYFPDGFTVYDGEGAWRNPKTGIVTHEATKIVVIATQGSAKIGPQIAAVSNAYRHAFHQTAVGVLSTPGCGAF